MEANLSKYRTASNLTKKRTLSLSTRYFPSNVNVTQNQYLLININTNLSAFTASQQVSFRFISWNSELKQ
jgi:hypothetical protein